MLKEVDGGNGYGIDTQANPDYLIEGKAFDCYSPESTTSYDAICRQLTRKSKHQAERLILNLEDYPSSEVEGLIQKIIGKTNEAGDLKHIEELFIVKDGKITRIF